MASPSGHLWLLGLSASLQNRVLPDESTLLIVWVPAVIILLVSSGWDCSLENAKTARLPYHAGATCRP